ncbi:MAG: 3-hydroxyacyl-CoA dehydrogenase/enoyl-CoA hydratase family protein, partial [bacterium]
FSKNNACLVTTGNFEDDMAKIADVDWVIEVVKEDLAIKKKVYTSVAKYWKPGTIVTSNTSGLSLEEMAVDMPDEMKKHFFITHFFNPPRYMKLLEIISGEHTDPALVKSFVEFGEKVLGKGIVYAKDTPNFIANRIGVYGMASVMHTVAGGEYRIDEIDQIMGVPMGRPKSAIFGTADIVGLDTLFHVINNVYEGVKDDPERDVFKPPEFLSKMIEKNLIGRKAKSGFFKMVKGEGEKNLLVINPQTLEYEAQQKLDAPSIKAAKGESDIRKRLHNLVYADDRAGHYAWNSIKNVCLYSVKHIPEIADDIVNVDNAMKWGFNWELGPFECWDAVGVRKSVEKMEGEGVQIPDKVKKMLEKGAESFYKAENGRMSYWDFATESYREIAPDPNIIDIKVIKKSDASRVVAKNTCASLVDIGDGVACLEFHSELQPEMNPIDDQIIAMMNKSVEIVGKDFVGLVIANHGKNFCVGANLMLLAMNAAQKNFALIEQLSKDFQDANQAMKFAPFPVVVAPHQMTLGGGCEVVLGADRVQASAETYIGLVEVGVGLIPAGGGCKELCLRAVENIPPDVDVSTVRFIGRAFEAIATAKVATSAQEAVDIGILRPHDKFSANHDHRINDAKNVVLGMVKAGYRPPHERKDIKVPGRTGIAAFSNIAWTMHQGGYATEYDLYLAKKVAYIVCGGDVPENTHVSEQYLLDLEREVFVHLCGQEKSIARMQHMLMKKKPLRN